MIHLTRTWHQQKLYRFFPGQKRKVIGCHGTFSMVSSNPSLLRFRYKIEERRNCYEQTTITKRGTPSLELQFSTFSSPPRLNTVRIDCSHDFSFTCIFLGSVDSGNIEVPLIDPSPNTEDKVVSWGYAPEIWFMGDLSRDKDVDGGHLPLLADALTVHSVRADVNGDGVPNDQDILDFASKYGKTW